MFQYKGKWVFCHLAILEIVPFVLNNYKFSILNVDVFKAIENYLAGLLLSIHWPNWLKGSTSFIEKLSRKDHNFLSARGSVLSGTEEKTCLSSAAVPYCNKLCLQGY